MLINIHQKRILSLQAKLGDYRKSRDDACPHHASILDASRPRLMGQSAHGLMSVWYKCKTPLLKLVSHSR
jgi:hypothetical protein